ncbi:MAG: ABC transporter permease [Anaerolineales bacterium]
MSLRRLWAVAVKEYNHIMRDPITLGLVLLAPTLVLFLMGFAMTVNIQHVPIAVLDYDHSPTSRAFIQRMTAGDDLDLIAQVNEFEEIDALLLRGKIKAAIVVNPRFAEELLAMRSMPLLVIIDGTEPHSGTHALDQIAWRTEEFISQELTRNLEALGAPSGSLQMLDLRVRTWFNPGLKSKNDVVPGLISLVLGLPAMSVALTLAREREHGTLEQLIATPVGRSELILGKMLPYVLVGLVNVILIPAIAFLVFRIPFHGNYLLFFLLSAIFLFAILSMGTIIGVFIRTQAAALALSFLVIFFPAFFLTGIFFPIAALPEVMRMESLVLPGTHFAIITRGIFLPGVGLDVLWPYAVMLFGLGVAFSAVAALFFRKKLG